MPSKETVLVIEDDINDRMLMDRAFRANGVMESIQMLADGEELVAYMSRKGEYADCQKFPHPSLIVTDLNADADGFKVLTHLKRNPQWANIPVVVLSGSDDPGDIKKAFALGADSYFVKPLDFLELRGLLKTLQTRWLSPAGPIASPNVTTNSLNDFRTDRRA